MCLLIGVTGVGKTLLLKRLKNFSSKGSFIVESEENLSTIPTVGTNLVNVNLSKKNEITVRELGGAMGPIWYNYFDDCSSLLFMIDASNPAQISASCIQLLTTVCAEKMRTVNVLILLNKIDCSLPMPLCEVKYLLRLDDLVRTAPQRITVLETSALTAQGLQEVIKWLAMHCKGE